MEKIDKETRVLRFLVVTWASAQELQFKNVEEEKINDRNWRGIFATKAQRALR